MPVRPRVPELPHTTIAGQFSAPGGDNWSLLLTVAFGDVMRGVPTILVVCLFGFAVPALNLSGVPTLATTLGGVALALCYSAYVSEVYASGSSGRPPSGAADARAGLRPGARSALSTVLELRGVTKAYGEHEVLKGIDLAVGGHQAVALIGASGSGKSRLLRAARRRLRRS